MGKVINVIQITKYKALEFCCEATIVFMSIKLSVDAVNLIYSI
jgi:hypothetical protein